MNAIFTAIFIASGIILCLTAPDQVIPALLDGGKQAASAFLTLLCIYAVWTGLSRLSEDAHINSVIAKKMQPLCRRIFRTKSKAGGQDIAMNLTCNLLGLGGAATPYGVKAMSELDKEGNNFGRNLLFIINATSIQIVPSTVIALRASYGSAAAADIFLPSLIATTVCTGVAVTLYLLAEKIWH